MQREPKTCYVLIACDIRMIRDSLQRTIGNQQGYVVVGTASCSREVLRLVNAFKPDIVLADSGLAREDGLAQSVARVSPATRIVAFAVTESEQEILGCAEAGVAGYVLRDAALEDMIRALDATMRGELLCAPNMAARAFKRIADLAAHARNPPDGSCTLPSRQFQVLFLISEGLSNKEIARRLGIEVSTVKNHVHILLTKMGVRRRSQAVSRFQFMHPVRRTSFRPSIK